MPDAKRVPQFVAAFLAAGFAFSAGTALGWANPIEPKVDEGELDFDMSNDEFSWASSILPLGAVVACIPSGFLMDGIGRKLSAILMVIPYLMGWLSISFAMNFWMLIIGRFILGIAMGGSCVVIPMYIGEISQNHIRGILGSLFQLQITAGVLFVFIIGAFMNPLPMNIVCTIIPVVFAIIMIFLPETPQYLIKKDKIERAQKSFAWLRGKEYDAKPEMDDVKADIEAAKQEKTSFCESLRSRACKKALYITLSLMFFQQFSGINAVIFYSTKIFILAGSTLEPEYSTIIIGLVLVISTIVSALYVDKLGRRLLLMLSASVMALSTLVLGVYFFLKNINESLVENIGWLPLVALCIYITMFSFGFGPVPWIMVGELFAPETKGPAGSLACISNFLSVFVVTKIFPIVEKTIGTGQSFWIFSILSIIGLIFVLFFVPETKNKSFSEIQENFKDEK